MNSIFIRVYLHMLLAMLLVVTLSVGAVSLINHIRAEQYREQLASGLFYLISYGWQQQPSQQRSAWLDRIADHLGTQIYTLADDQAGLSAWQLQRLSENRVVLLPADTEDGVVVYRYLAPGQPLLMQARLSRLPEQSLRLTAELLHQMLQNSRQPQEVLASLTPYFAHNLALVSKDSATLTRTEHQYLVRGDTLLNLDSDSRHLVAYTLLNEQLLRVGPIDLFNPYPLSMIASVALIALLLSGSGVYVSVHLLERRLKKVEQAASRMANGHFGTRARLEGDDFAARLARAFNSMGRQVQELLRTQQEMIHAVSHELRTPVARIRFGMQMIEDMVDDPFTHKQLRGIDSDIQELDELVDEILTYARLGQETLELHYERAAVTPLLQSVVDGLQVLKPQLTLTVVHLNPDAGDDADIEVRYFQRAVQNLVSNACRYASDHVSISLYADSDSIRVDVEDDGAGIPETDWERVFTPFSRLDDSRTRASGGYGLGLSIVRRITHWHQGSAFVAHSQALGGARFSLIFPRYRVELCQQMDTDDRIQTLSVP